MRRCRRWLVVLLANLGGGFVGCGQGDSRDTPQTGDPEVAEDVRQPNDINFVDAGRGETLLDLGYAEGFGQDERHPIPEEDGESLEDIHLPDQEADGISDAPFDVADQQADDLSDAPSDVACEPPFFSDDCSLVTEFQCGFMARCEGGVLLADWHHHWFCDGEEEITPFECAYACPHGCLEGEIVDWPPDGETLVKEYCFECSQPSDCEGLDHPACVGYWECDGGKCSWICDNECVGEGGKVAVVPWAPECCPGLVKVPCDVPGPQGECQMCVGVSICTYCGNGECGKGENRCNCPQDCAVGCLGLGDTFFDFHTAGKCCPGLTPMHDCHITALGGCSCPKCPCYICLPCGDGVCGPFEHLCNCKVDCPTAEKCVPTKKSQCLGNPYGAEPAGKLAIEVVGHDIILRHEAVVLNCCLETTVCYTPKVGSIEVVERQGGGPPCFCQCLFDIVATLEGIRSGTYDLTLFNEEQGKVLFQETVEVP